MATSKVSQPTNNHSGHSASGKPRLPPDEKFWKRYSPHHEFPLSSVVSISVHALVIILLVFGSYLALKLGWTDTRKPLPMQPVEIAGGGGNPDGVGEGPADGVLPNQQEAVPTQKDPSKEPIHQSAAPELATPTKESTPIPEPKDQTDNERFINAGAAAFEGITAEKEQIRKRIEGIVAGKGKGGSGQGGGKGKGIGTGEGDLQGPGKSGTLEQRQKRQLRWTMNFRTQNGRDYVKQLQALGAKVAVPMPQGGFVVIRDLSRPGSGKPEDISEFHEIFWIDNKPDSVQSVTSSLGMPRAPYFVAFLPESLEKELLEMEMKYFQSRRPNGTEDEIESTRFDVVRSGSTFEPRVVMQKLNR